MQCACAILGLYCHLWPVRFYHTFPLYLINGTIFGKSVTEHKMCVWILSPTFVWNISHTTKNSAICCHKCIYVARLLFFPDFNDVWIFSINFRKIIKCHISWKPFQWKPSSSLRMEGCTDGQTGTTKLILAFRNFVNAPQKSKILSWHVFSS
jgi:hypothetical protein